MPDLFDSGVFGQNVPAWHGQGRVVAGTFSYEEALELGGLNWETEKAPLLTTYRGQTIPVKDKYAIVRSDNASVLGVAGAEYRPIQNRAAFSFLDQLLADKVCRWETAISVDGGRQVAGIISLPDSGVEIMKGDKHFLYLTVVSSHDGTSALKAFPTDVRVVCANTIHAAISGRDRGLTVNIRHSGDISSKIRAGQDVIAKARKDYAEFCLWQQNAAEVGVSKSQYEQFLEELFPMPTPDADGTVSKRAETIRANKVLALTAGVRTETTLLPQYTATAGLRPAMSVYTLLNGVTRYVDHDLAASKPDRGTYALITGGVDVKAKAMAAIAATFPELAK